MPVLRIEPRVSEVWVGPGESVALEVMIYGRQDILDKTLNDSVRFDWSERGSMAGGGKFLEASVGDGDGESDDWKVIYRAPDTPGEYEVGAKVMDGDCLGRRAGESAAEAEARCEALFSVSVLSPLGAVDDARPTPDNPVGDVPIVIAGSNGIQHGVFTPEEGGRVEFGGCEFSAPPGAVPNLEVIGVAAEVFKEEFSNRRFAHRGARCRLSVVDSEGRSVSDYSLWKPSEVCLPMPDEFLGRIDKINIALFGSDDAAQLLSSTVRLNGRDGALQICGSISSLPLTAGVVTSAADQLATTPTPIPPATPDAPETGGYGPSSRGALLLLMLIGISATAIAVAMLRGGRRRNDPVK